VTKLLEVGHSCAGTWSVRTSFVSKYGPESFDFDTKVVLKGGVGRQMSG